MTALKDEQAEAFTLEDIMKEFGSAAQDPADNGEIEGKGISELPRRFWEQRIKAEDADWGVVVQVTAGYPHSALPWALAPDEGPDDLS